MMLDTRKAKHTGAENLKETTIHSQFWEDVRN